jgi:hypothetical protein
LAIGVQHWTTARSMGGTFSMTKLPTSSPYPWRLPRGVSTWTVSLRPGRIVYPTTLPRMPPVGESSTRCSGGACSPST